jgi:SAM-dependent methyltransferase
MAQTSPPLDPERLKDYARRVFGLLEGAVTSALVHLGDRLGLYRALAEGGSADARELAARTGLAERWVREWLYNQAAAGLLEGAEGERFRLPVEGAALLAQESHPAFGGGLFSQLPQLIGVLDRLPEAFRTGLGLPYDAFGPEGARGVERGYASWYRSCLVPLVVDRVSGLRERLEAGAEVADVGCGAGVALIELGKAFPRCELHGYEISRHALDRAEANRCEADLAHVHFHDASRDPLPGDGRFALVLTFDCLHDMTRPGDVMAAIRRAIAPDGVWLIADIKSHPTFEENLERNPMCALMYGISVLSCMSSGLSESGGAGLGTLGLHEGLAREMAERAGFTSFRRLDLDHPVNAFYEVRP